MSWEQFRGSGISIEPIGGSVATYNAYAYHGASIAAGPIQMK